MDDVIRQLRKSVEKGDKSKIIELVDNIIELFSKQRRHEDPIIILAKRVREVSDRDSDAFDTASRFNQEFAELETARSKVISSLETVLFDAPSSDETIERITELNEAINKRNQSIQTLVEAKQQLDLPAILALTGPRDTEVPKGGTVSIALSLENVGNTAAEEIAVTVEGDLDLTADPGTITDLGKDDSREITVSGQATGAGEFRGTAIARDGDTTASHDMTLIVVDKTSHLERALQQTRDLQDTLAGFDLTQPAATDGGEPGKGKGGGNAPAAVAVRAAAGAPRRVSRPISRRSSSASRSSSSRSNRAGRRSKRSTSRSGP